MPHGRCQFHVPQDFHDFLVCFQPQAFTQKSSAICVGASSVMIQSAPPPAVSSTGRKLLQLEAHVATLEAQSGFRRKVLQAGNSSVPVTINSADYQQLLQQLGNLSSGSNLTTALQQAGKMRRNFPSIDTMRCLLLVTQTELRVLSSEHFQH